MFKPAYLVILSIGFTGAAASEQAPVSEIYEDESTLRFRTSDLVPAEVLKGPNYELDPESSLNDGQFVFRIRTQWGVLAAHGKPMLALRLGEMYAIERARRMNREPQLIGSFLYTLVDSKKGAQLLLTDPLGSVLRVPGGLELAVELALHGRDVDDVLVTLGRARHERLEARVEHERRHRVDELRLEQLHARHLVQQ